MGSMVRSLTLAARALARRPGFAAVIVLTLALGIGASTAVFSVVRSVVLRPLPFPEADRLAVLLLDMQSVGYAEGPPSPPEYVIFRDQMRSWEQLAAHTMQGATVTGSEGDPERVTVASTTWNLFPALRVEPLLGRTFTSDEDVDGSDGVAVLSHAYWQGRYGADPDVVGRSVTLDGRARTIVGVMPESFDYPSPDVRLWVPLALTEQTLRQRGNHQFTAVGRLRPGVTLPFAQTELAAVMERVVADASFNFHDWHPTFLRPLHTEIVGDVSRALWMVLGAVGLVLAIACANVANLMLVRADERAREMALRTALGADRTRLVGQLLAESLVLTTAGGLAGVALAYLGVEALLALAPPELPRLDEISVDGGVLLFALAVVAGATLVFALLPAIQVGRANLQATLREDGRTATAGRGGVRLRQALVVSETGLAVVLLVAAGLLLQSFRRLTSVDPGFRSEGVLTAQLTIPRSSYPEEEDVIAFYDALVARVREIPGVSSAGAVSFAPLSTPVGPSNFFIEGWEPRSGDDFISPLAVFQVVTPAYFETMGVPVVEGRAFEIRDRLGQPPVVVVSETVARAYWPGRNAIGGRLRVDDPEVPLAEVVGVVPDVRQNRLDALPPYGTVYIAQAQSPALYEALPSMTLAALTTVEPTTLAQAIRRAVSRIDASVPVYDVRTMEQAMREATAPQRFATSLQLLFALVALALAAVGLYGVLAFAVSRRTAEMGVRMALGAQRSNVRGMVVRQGMVIVLIALSVGVVVALAAGRLIEGLLFGISARDPITYAVVVAVLLAVAFLACWVPARRASATDPLVALRAE